MPIKCCAASTIRIVIFYYFTINLHIFKAILCEIKHISQLKKTHGSKRKNSHV